MSTTDGQSIRNQAPDRLGTDVPRRTLSPEAIADLFHERLERRVVDHEIAWGQLTVTVAPDALPTAVQLCRDDPALACDFFDFMSGVDEREDGFAVVVHLYSTHHRHHVQIRALAPGGRESPRLPTITHLYRGADWHERETYDMFGVEFEGHPNLLPRILTVENFEGFPLRKDFLLMSREVKPWPGLKEPKEVEEEDDEGDASGDGEAQARKGPSAEDKARMAREKAERAKAKAAEARKRRAREQAEALEPSDVGRTQVDEETDLPPRGPGEEEPRALAEEGVEVQTLASEVDADVGEPHALEAHEPRPIGTDADDRVRPREHTGAGAAERPAGIDPDERPPSPEHAAAAPAEQDAADEGQAEQAAADEGQAEQGAADEGQAEQDDAEEDRS